MSDIDVLIQRWQDGDERAAEAIYDRYSYRMFDLACFVLNDESDAEEAVQDALFSALRHIDQYDPRKGKFITWLRQITLNRCRKNRPSRLRRSTIWLSNWFERGGDAPDLSPGPESRAIRQEKQDEVWQAIQTLSAPLREAVILRYYCGCTFEEIAYGQNCKMRTAQSRIRLSHKRLKDILARNEASYSVKREDRLR